MSQTIIQCKNISHSFSNITALNKVNFEINAGEPIGLVGPNGAGKTTLFNILCGYLRPSNGSVSLFGYQPGASELSGKISALPQDAQFDPNFSIGEQLIFYARLQGFSKGGAKSEVSRVLEAVDLSATFNKKPKTLSHGMGKRIAIAQSFIGLPQLIFLDEPTAGLDPVNTRIIRSLITEYSKKTTFIISSHDLTELGRVCQQVLMLDKGEMSATHLTTTDAKNTKQFLTLQLETYPATEVINTILQLTGVIQVSTPQKNEYIVEYDTEQVSNIDAKIIMLLSEKNWHYRQLSRGKTLEEKLFFEKITSKA